MGDLIHDTGQTVLPLAATDAICKRCKGQGTTYRTRVRGVEVIGGKRILCPECGGVGVITSELRLEPGVTVQSIRGR
jgi:DnaJ-class molecular chaperone